MMKPTMALRFMPKPGHRDMLTGQMTSPRMILQQMWIETDDVLALRTTGEWRDVPVVGEVREEDKSLEALRAIKRLTLGVKEANADFLAHIVRLCIDGGAR